ncbi:MAG: Radical SAM domain protein [Atribacteria bacterium 34_868]|nr:MAG: Radical SAM domain protein [Atribacteria bacterium 34_868]
MAMIVIKEIRAKTILSKSKVYEYVINPYLGCQHSCTYCYARFMKKYSGHREAWGQFVDVKVNAPELLKKEIAHKKQGEVWISGVCDPYQPRIIALGELHQVGIKTYTMIAPLLPGAEDLAEILAGKVDYIIIDRMNYNHANWVYQKYRLKDKKTAEFFQQTEKKISSAFQKLGPSVSLTISFSCSRYLTIS